MDSGKTLEMLFQAASEYRFNDFETLFAKLAADARPPEARLLRAQIKLFAADETLGEELEAAAGVAARLHPCLDASWPPTSPNRFVVFGAEPGALQRFAAALPEAARVLERQFGIVGRGMAQQIHSELLYYQGEFKAALALAGLPDENRSPAEQMMALYVRFRCHLAAGPPEKAENCMLEMIQLANGCPECVGPYRVIRDWANMTTGWSGDTPRFADGSAGQARPVLDDRLDAIRQGISHLADSEAPFAAYACGFAAGARRHTAGACTMRRHYMDIFHALYWHNAGDRQQAATYFHQACRVAVAAGLVMPFVEYGRQIIPLLFEAGHGDEACPAEWAERVVQMAERYEENLAAYRG